MDKSQQAIQIFNDFAREYQAKYMDVEPYGESLRFFCASIDKERAEILELACGPGNITRYLLQQRPDLRILGTDLSVNMIELARKNNPTADFQLMDCRDIKEIGKKYDGIIAGFCLPYLSREEAVQLIKDAAEILKSNGVFYLSTTEGDYSKSEWKGASSGGERQLFIHYHQADYLTEALVANGFEAIELSRIHREELKDLLIVAKRVN